MLIPVFLIRISLNADPDPGFYLNADPDSDPKFELRIRILQIIPNPTGSGSDTLG